jgi:hypothetical protein
MFTSPLGTQRQMQEAGLTVEAMFDPDGGELPLKDRKTSQAPWYHVVARKLEPFSAGKSVGTVESVQMLNRSR